MRYLIIGGTGVLGECLIEKLLLNPENSITATKFSSKTALERSNLTWKELDICAEDKCAEIIRNADADIIFDMAAQDSVGYSWKNPTDTVNINVVGTINILNAVRDYSMRSRLIIAGSGEEYGRMDFDSLPLKEELNPLPYNIFGATKACQTMFAKLYAQAFGMDIIVIRAFYETSVKQGENFAVSSFCKQFAEMEAGIKEPVLFTGNLNNIRDFTDVDDLVNAFCAVAEKGKSGEVYNAGRGMNTSLLDVIHTLEIITGITPDIHMDFSRIRPMDSPAVVADVNKIFQDTGWRAEISFEQTIRKMLNHWRDTFGLLRI